MAGLVPAIPTWSAPALPDRDRRDKRGDDIGLELAMKMYWVYILASRPGGALYVGVTNNLSLRVYQHKQGRASEHTRRYNIDKLVYYESYADIRDAIQREKNIKHWPRSWKTRLIYSMNPTWRDLYEELNR